MKVDVHGIGSEVFFINDKQKIDFGYVTEVYFEMKRTANSDGCSPDEVEGIVDESPFQTFKAAEE